MNQAIEKTEQAGKNRIYRLSTFQKERVKIARDELQNNQTTSHAEFQKVIDEKFLR